MSITSPKTLSDFLEQQGVRAKKSLSQNFLIDQNITQKIARSADLVPGDVVIEIGPGPGGLTEELLKNNVSLICIEKDHVFATALKRFEHSGDLTVYEADVLDFDIETVLKQRLEKGQKAKVVANLPYHITTPILAKLLNLNELIDTVTVMVQKEVGKRFIADPGSGDYSSISLFLNFFSEVKYLFDVSHNCFHPKPKVDSAMIQLQIKESFPDVAQDHFFQLTRTAFNQRRKMLRASLKEIYPTTKVVAALTHMGLKESARPQELSLKLFIQLYHLLNP